jgi:hypothetical protein
MGAVGKDDLLPRNEDVQRRVGRDGDPRQPGERLRTARNIGRPRQQRLALRRKVLEVNGLAPLVGPGHRGMALRVDGDRWVVHIVEAGLVLAPRPTFTTTGGDFGDAVPCDAR